MAGSFDLPVYYNNQELSFTTQLQQTGFTHRFQVTVNESIILFEPDEEMNYRAVLEPGITHDQTTVKPGLLQAIAETLEELVK